jgi:hypothetical protein
MAYTDYPGMRGLGASGAYGTMPEDMYLRKIEATNMVEDPFQVENYLRAEMRDFKPDKPFLASDQIRSSDDRGGGFHSKRFLNLRHHGTPGAPEDPYLPDGTFLDHQFMERDPRGHATTPDMRKHYEQQMARAGLIKFYNDEDLSVPEQGISPEQMVSNIKSGMYMFKDRYKNFSESYGNWHNGGSGLTRRSCLVSNAAKQTMDGTIMDLADATQKNRTDAVSKLSMDPRVAFRHSTPDHRVKISKYGAVRVQQSVQENDWSRNRSGAFLDHNTGEVIDGQRVNKQLANLIADIQGLRETKQEIAKGAEYSDSFQNQVRSKKMSQDDVYKLLMIRGTQPRSANEELSGHVHRNAPVLRSDNRKAMNKASINHEILESMQNATRRKKEDRKDIREHVQNTIAIEGFTTEVSNRSFKQKKEPGNRETRASNRFRESKSTKTYSGIKPSNDNSIHSKVDVMQSGHESWLSKHKRRRLTNPTSNTTSNNDYEQDQGRLDFGVYDKAFKEDAREHMGRNAGTEISDEMGEEIGELDL